MMWVIFHSLELQRLMSSSRRKVALPARELVLRKSVDTRNNRTISAAWAPSLVLHRLIQ
jgi:hypothetical protein